MSGQCFQASCLLLIVVSSILSLPFPPVCVVPGPLSHSNVLFGSDKNNCFYFARITKILGSTFPWHVKYHLKNHISDSSTILFIVSFISPRSSLFPSSFCWEIFITLLFLNTSFHCFLSQQYPTHL